MFRIIPQKNNVAVEINCDLNKLTSYKLKKIKSALNNYGLVYFRTMIPKSFFIYLELYLEQILFPSGSRI